MIAGLEIARSVGWCAATVVVYGVAREMHRKARHHPLLNSVITTSVLTVLALHLSGTDLATYKRATYPLALLLGPATVAFAAPVFRRISELRKVLAPAAAAIAAGSLAASISAMLCARLLGGSEVIVRSLAAKSVTTPIAMAVSASVGGNPDLTAGFVIFTGIIGAVAIPSIFDRLGLADRRARGLAAGIAAHGFGTARSLALGDVEGVFAILGMGLSGIFVPVVIPAVVHFFF